MQKPDVIALGALVITGIGWLVNFLVQMAVLQQQRKTENGLVVLQERFAQMREHRQYDLPTKLEALKNVTDWLESGMGIVLLHQRWVVDFPRTHRLQQAELKKVIQRDEFDWRRRAPTHIMLAEEYDPGTDTVPRIELADKGEFDGDFPTTLPDLLQAYLTKVNHLSERAGELAPMDEVSSIVGTLLRLQHASLKRIERIRQFFIRSSMSI